MGDTPPFEAPRKLPSTHMKHKKILTKDAWDNFDNIGKNIFTLKIVHPHKYFSH